MYIPVVHKCQNTIIKSQKIWQEFILPDCSNYGICLVAGQDLCHNTIIYVHIWQLERVVDCSQNCQSTIINVLPKFQAIWLQGRSTQSAGQAMAGPVFAAGTKILNIEDMHFKHTFKLEGGGGVLA